MKDLIWNSSDATIVVSVGTAVVCFCVYWFVTHTQTFKNWIEAGKGRGFFSYYGAFYQKALGMLLLGVIPALIAFIILPRTWTEYGVGFADWSSTLYWILFFGGGLSFVPWYSARQKAMYDFYPQIRVPEWTWGLLLLNGVFWVLYLFAYEYLFRGFLFANLMASMDMWPAIIVTTAISSITHMPKGSKETFGTIPLSIILCLIVVQTGGIWACVVVHAILAISNDYWALFYHPDMQFSVRRPLEEAKRQL